MKSGTFAYSLFVPGHDRLLAKANVATIEPDAVLRDGARQTFSIASIQPLAPTVLPLPPRHRRVPPIRPFQKISITAAGADIFLATPDGVK